jgi:thioredoxin reductase (NADPH)
VEAIRQLKRRNEELALVLADQRMPGITGIEVLAAAAEYFPRVRRVLLTAYADTEVAIQAINSTKSACWATAGRAPASS